VKNPIQGMGAIFYKEVRHMRRDPMAFLFAFVMPVLQLVILAPQSIRTSGRFGPRYMTQAAVRS
jgi:hypothetical protein